MRNVDGIIDAVKIIDEEMVVEGQNLNSWSRKVLKTKGKPQDAIFYDRPPSILTEVQNAINMCKSNIQAESRASIALQGLAARYDTTASEYTQQGAAAGRGINRLLRKFENNIIKPYHRFKLAYNLQFMERSTLIKILGKKAASAALKNPDKPDDSIERTPSEAIEGDYEFVPIGVLQMENKVIKSQQLMNFLNIIKTLPMIQQIVNMALLVKKIWDLLGDGDDNMILPQNSDPEMDPNDENLLITMGCDVPVNPKDNDEKHIADHAPLQAIPELIHFKTDHLQKHFVQKQKKMMAMAQAQGGPGQSQPNFGPKPPMPQPAAPPMPPVTAGA
jgi:hypothetical protein